MRRGKPSGRLPVLGFRFEDVDVPGSCQALVLRGAAPKCGSGARVSTYTVAREMGHGGEAMVRRVYGKVGRVRHRPESTASSSSSLS